MKTVAIVQARMGSKRFPKKVLAKVGDKTLIEILLTRLNRSTEIDEICVAIADDSGAQELRAHVEKLGYSVFVGHESDVLNRYASAAKTYNADIIVRITGDCPLVDFSIVDQIIRLRKSSGSDYASNTNPPSYPDGFDVEVFTRQALEKADLFAQTAFQREHVTPYILENSEFSKSCLRSEVDFSWLRLTVDERVDLEVIRGVFEEFSFDDSISLGDVLELHKVSPELFSMNQNIGRNEGSDMSTGQKLWKRAKDIIPGGNMLLSKRSEMFLPDKWPSYFSRSKGCEVWDLDGNRFLDMSTMSVGTNTLGYGDEIVDEAVLRVIRDGNMSTLNAPEEVFLAEKLLDLHPWAGMVRFARTGGEANSIAVRIARAHVRKEKIAICGYHGWHDWYLSANLADDATLDGHLLPGLEPNGVPRSLTGTVVTFRYNDIESLKVLLEKGDIGVIKMEVVRSDVPTHDFLQQVRDLATKFGAVLIFDECTSGFRESFGGLHLNYKVTPDIAVFGKALGNGYAITSVIGRKEVMQSAQTTFISSTFWTERIGVAAGIATLDRMQDARSWEVISKIGSKVKAGWGKLSDKYAIPTTVFGLDALASFRFDSPNHLKLKTFMTQEMLKQGFLASTSFYASTAHSESIIQEYFAALDSVFDRISDFSAISEIPLDGPVCHDGFKRLN